MENLPTDIELEILSHLPAELLFKCRQGGGEWGTLLRQPFFIDMHLRQALQVDNVGHLYLKGESDGSEKQLYYGEYDASDECYKTIRSINHPPIRKHDIVVGSCNGLICLSINGSYDINECVYICNPVTREYINLPSCNIDYRNLMERYLIVPMMYGFGYLPSTNEYKVIRVLFRQFSSEWVGSVQVYTLGSGKGWRDKGEITYLLSWECIPANGALHWLNGEERKIIVFDLADEKFQMLPTAPCFAAGMGNFFQLKVLGKMLCLIHKGGESINVWSFKKKETYTSTSNIKEQEYQSWSWHKEFSMAWEGLLTHEYELFALTNSGEVLMWYKSYNIETWFSDKQKHSILCRYDPKNATLEKLDRKMIFLNIVPHLNSLLSLKALGEKDSIIAD